MVEHKHPITPPPELLQQWATEYWGNIATHVARWGADQELEACCEWLGGWPGAPAVPLRAARRSKPPRLAEEALNELDLVPTHDQDGRSIDADTSVIRRALERLQELEHND